MRVFSSIIHLYLDLIMKFDKFKIIFTFAVLGVLDTAYLTWEHFTNTVPPCSNNIFIDCGKVLNSQYSVVFGIPLALIGLVHYSLLFVVALFVLRSQKRIFKYIILIQSLVGFLASIYLMYLQLIVIGSICLYCTASALISFTLFYLIWSYYSEERKRLSVITINLTYKYVVKKILFLIDPELVHNSITYLGNRFGKSALIKNTAEFILKHKSDSLTQKIEGINFENPIGLAAGFDYEARLTQLLPSLDFGFMTVGTITNMPYEGNPRPRLGRLPKSMSLMVNKGFKSTGAPNVSKNLKNLNFKIPVGISIGRTNSPKLINQKDSIQDIVRTFETFENFGVKNSYYELNISCPNLIHGDVTFYPSKNLDNLLNEIDKLKIKKPIFVKMPIEKSNKEVLAMLKVISRHCPKGVIFGNLQKDRNDPALVKEEVEKFNVGNFSGKPTYRRSNELIRIAYKHYKDRFTIIGCGGVFSGSDAWEKITLGASLVQLITGLIFEGPQLVAQINFELSDILKKEGFKNISEAVGVDNR